MKKNCQCKVRGFGEFPENDLAPLMALDRNRSVQDWIELIEAGMFEHGLTPYNGAICAQISGLYPERWACFYSNSSITSGRLMILDDYHKFDYRNIPQ
jgi:hypothetical protein